MNRQTYVKTFEGREQENLYDGEGLRAGVSESGKSSTFIFHNGEILAECDENRTPVKRHLQGQGLSCVQTLNDSAYHTYHQDEQGSIAYITGNSGVVENSYAYDAFGNVLAGKESIENRIRYTGQQYDQETRQYYLRARYYNPVIGRFTQEDIYRGDGLNLYAYCANNLVIYYDPSGYQGGGIGQCKGAGQAECEEQKVAGESSSNTKPMQEHHYATNKSKTYTPQLEEITNKYGLGLDDAWNKDLLPHQGRHPNAYHEYILDSMNQFDDIAQGDKDMFLKLFDNLKNNVKSHPDMLYKEYWK